MVRTDFVLETARLRLRPYSLADLDAIAAILGDAATMRYYPQPFTREQSQQWIQQNLRRYRVHGHGLWAMDVLATGEFAGNCGLVVQMVEGVREVEIGWHVARHLWGRGLAPEAAEACRDYATSQLGITRLISLIRPENTQSRRVAEKIGMVLERQTVWAGMLHGVYVWPPPDPDTPPALR